MTCRRRALRRGWIPTKDGPDPVPFLQGRYPEGSTVTVDLEAPLRGGPVLSSTGELVAGGEPGGVALASEEQAQIVLR